MHVVETIAELRRVIQAGRQLTPTRPWGLVPTMGALHAGHVSLMEQARAEGCRVAVTIFVNPTQFGPNEDLARYPRPRDQDLEHCAAAGAEVVFYPAVAEVYPPGFATYVEVQGLSSVLEGAIRPGHFRGVATVVTKLLLAAGAEHAYFGEKDYQQLTVIRRLVHDLHLPTEIIGCPTIREPDGLAMSSRNAYLSPSERADALCLSRGLAAAARAFAAGERHPEILAGLVRREIEQTAGARLDYAVAVHPETLVELAEPAEQQVLLVAARLGSTRLIDNRVLGRA